MSSKSLKNNNITGNGISVPGNVSKIYISQLFLNLHSKQVRIDIGNIHEMHRTLMKAFDSESDDGSRGRNAFQLLHRVESKVYNDKYRGRLTTYPKILVQSSARPDWSKLPKNYISNNKIFDENPRIKEIDVNAFRDLLLSNPKFKFRFRVNPTKKVKAEVKKGSGKFKKNSIRVPLRKPQEIVDWLLRKGDQCGFKILKVSKVDPIGQIIGYKNQKSKDVDNTASKADLGVSESKPKKKKLTFEGFDVEGILKVESSEEFLNTFIQGLGPGKSYGFGLISIARI